MRRGGSALEATRIRVILHSVTWDQVLTWIVMPLVYVIAIAAGAAEAFVAWHFVAKYW